MPYNFLYKGRTPVIIFAGMKRLTTSEVAKRLGVAQVTVNVWCLNGKFPGADREETPRGPVWTIPESDLEGFEMPKLGRRPKPKGEEQPKKARKKRGEKQ